MSGWAESEWRDERLHSAERQQRVSGETNIDWVHQTVDQSSHQAFREALADRDEARRGGADRAVNHSTIIAPMLLIPLIPDRSEPRHEQDGHRHHHRCRHYRQDHHDHHHRPTLTCQLLAPDRHRSRDCHSVTNRNQWSAKLDKCLPFNTSTIDRRLFYKPFRWQLWS